MARMGYFPANVGASALARAALFLNMLILKEVE